MKLADFLAKWGNSGGAERANKDSFLRDFCDVLGVETPRPTTGDPEQDKYVFERQVHFLEVDGTKSLGYIDLYKEGCFVLEAKQGSTQGSAKLGTARRDSHRWHLEMENAIGQARSYARTFTKPPPFIIVADLGYCFDVLATFDGTHDYRPFPTGTMARFRFADFEKHLDFFRRIFTDPYSLDPSRNAAKVTRDVAEKLAELAKELEKSGHTGELMARFLMRCLFTMFAEDVGLLPDRLFTGALKDHWRTHPERFAGGVSALWRAMNVGDHYGPLGKLLQFNGGLFRDAEAIELEPKQLDLLLEAASFDWSQVEPAIFGTLLERALDEKERHKLGAHYTPRAYVERLVKPTIEEPLREEWLEVQADVRTLLRAAERAKTEKTRKQKGDEALELVHGFQRRLATLRVLDPACGTGNFLYVALDVFKRLESEVLAQLEALGEVQQGMELHGLRVTPQQFLGIEIKPWAKEIAELVLWIGYLQWHFRTYGKASVPEPVLRDYKNIECRDAVLAWDGEPVPRLDEDGKPVTRWDGESMRLDPVTGREVPDESRQVETLDYLNPRPAEWPRADFIVGNPPFLGNKRMRSALGDGYVEALRRAHDGVPDSADYVMYWWTSAARSVQTERSSRFGLITTNSITQTGARAATELYLRDPANPVSIVFAIPDHPWVASEDGANVRVSMSAVAAGHSSGLVLRVSSETQTDDADAAVVLFHPPQVGIVSSRLTVGAAVESAVPLMANKSLSFQGFILVGKGFVIDQPQLESLRLEGDVPRSLVRPWMNGKDLMSGGPSRWVIDLHGLEEAQVRAIAPLMYQYVLTHVKPHRDQAARKNHRIRWWIWGESRPGMRRATEGLERVIVTSFAAKHRVFCFFDPSVAIDHNMYVIAQSDAFFQGVLSSKVHVTWMLAAGSKLEDRPLWVSTTCFLPFAFPAATEPQKDRIRDLGERLDAHRKRQLALHPKLTITAMYNVLEKLRSGEALSDKDRVIHEQGLVSLLKQIHDELDEAVFDAYGWPRDLTDEQILERLVALNAERAKEEAAGHVRWLRPEYQAKATQTATPEAEEPAEADEPEAPARPSQPPPSHGAKAPGIAWPAKTSERMAAIRQALADGHALSAVELAKRLKGAKVDQVEDLVDGMAAFGGLVRIPGDEPRFKAVG